MIIVTEHGVSIRPKSRSSVVMEDFCVSTDLFPGKINGKIGIVIVTQSDQLVFIVR